MMQLVVWWFSWKVIYNEKLFLKCK